MVLTFIYKLCVYQDIDGYKNWENWIAGGNSYQPNVKLHVKKQYNKRRKMPKITLQEINADRQTESRDCLKTQLSICNGLFLQKQLTVDSRYLFSQKASSQMLDWVLNKPLRRMTIAIQFVRKNVSLLHFQRNSTWLIQFTRYSRALISLKNLVIQLLQHLREKDPKISEPNFPAKYCVP